MAYLLKSVSQEGTYYLVNHWQQEKAFWSRQLFKCRFRRPQDCKTSLAKLLKVMGLEYGDDDFTLIKERADHIQTPIAKIKINKTKNDWDITYTLETLPITTR